MFLTRTEYDRGVNTFSPEGRLFQVEYAIEATKLGSTAIGICTQDGVILGVERRIKSSLMETETVEKVFQIDDHIGCAASGLAADSRTLVDRARVECANHFFVYDEKMKIESVAQVCSNHAIKFGDGSVEGDATMCRPFGVAMMFGGYDEKRGMQLFHLDPSGTFTRFDAKAIGSGGEGAFQNILEQYSKSMTLKEATGLLLSTLKLVMEEELNENNVELATVTKERLFQKLSKEDIAKELMVIGGGPSSLVDVESYAVSGTTASPGLPLTRKHPSNDNYGLRALNRKVNDLAEAVDEVKILVRASYELLNQTAGTDDGNGARSFETLIGQHRFVQTLPVKTVEDFESFDRKIDRNTAGRQEIIRFLIRVGGRTYKECVKRFTSRIIENEVAQQYSLVGHKGKKKFSETNSCQVIIEAVQALHTVTAREIEIYVGLWLAKATERLGRRAINSDDSEQRVEDVIRIIEKVGYYEPKDPLERPSEYSENESEEIYPPTETGNGTASDGSNGPCKITRIHRCIRNSGPISSDKLAEGLCYLSKDIMAMSSDIALLKNHLLSPTERGASAGGGQTRTELIGDVDFLELGDYPIRTVEGLKRIEGKLTDKTFFRKSVAYFKSNAGKSSESKTIKSTLQKMIEPSIAADYTWKGMRRKDQKKEKNAFERLLLAKVLVASSRAVWPKLDVSRISAIASTWLAQNSVKVWKKESMVDN